MVADDETIGYTDCGCGAPFVPGVVLDPFAGVGTSLYVARQLGRRYVGIELSEPYAAMAAEKLRRWWDAPSVTERAAPDAQAVLL
jgi:tRNA G10  N-methylase Trm11